MRVFDSHCHLGLDDHGDAAAEYQRATTAAVTDLLLVGVDAATSARARDRARSWPGARWSAGLHPNAAHRLAAEWHDLELLAAATDCAAIGETGLDFFRESAPIAAQHEALHAQLDLARRQHLPVILHCRQAFDALAAALADRRPVRGVLHCFGGDTAQARRAIDLGLHVSFAAPLTYPKNEVLRQAAAAVPADRLLIETDAPFLPPQSRRGQRNEPAFVRETLRALAQARGVDEVELAALTHANAVRLFARA